MLSFSKLAILVPFAFVGLVTASPTAKNATSTLARRDGTDPNLCHPDPAEWGSGTIRCIDSEGCERFGDTCVDDDVAPPGFKCYVWNADNSDIGTPIGCPRDTAKDGAKDPDGNDVAGQYLDAVCQIVGTDGAWAPAKVAVCLAGWGLQNGSDSPEDAAQAICDVITAGICAWASEDFAFYAIPSGGTGK
ncbi:hypothetical protein EXIGLDRAFT_792597 [Exidia glandulosa HHB12029]|uniref:Uncharacterized protein n=1 Tax=Exidia glandulosa HHB12029 TaxID=1314781 RepID=A0A165NS98_EXIGL|nr:hypothetical protein EXIGLDRAFT_792597 [Exidia glandulosa HHB12029]